MKIACLFNPGVFRFNHKIWLLLRVAERPVRMKGVISFPIYNEAGQIVVLSFDKNDPQLDARDPRVIGYQGKNYLTTLSYLRLVCSDDGINFFEDPAYPPIFGNGDLEAFGIEDCRVATTPNGFFLTFTEVSSVAVGVGIMHTTDWKTFNHHGMMFPHIIKIVPYLKKKSFAPLILSIRNIRDWRKIIYGTEGSQMVIKSKFSTKS